MKTQLQSVSLTLGGELQKRDILFVTDKTRVNTYTIAVGESFKIKKIQWDKSKQQIEVVTTWGDGWRNENLSLSLSQLEEKLESGVWRLISE